MLTEVFTATAPILCGIDVFQKNHPNGVSRVHASHWSLTYTLSGSGYALSEDSRHQINPGFATLTPVNRKLMLTVPAGSEQWVYYWAAFRTGRLSPELVQFPTILPSLLGLQIEAPDLRDKVHSAFSGLIDAMQNRYTVRRYDLAYNRLEEILLWLDVANSASSIGKSDARVARIIQYVKMNFQRRLTVDDLARIAGIGDSRFSHLFSELVGMPPMKFVESIRLAKACELLESSSYNITEIADKCGFGTVNYFSKVFKKNQGIQPTEYRRRKQRSERAQEKDVFI